MVQVKLFILACLQTGSLYEAVDWNFKSKLVCPATSIGNSIGYFGREYCACQFFLPRDCAVFILIFNSLFILPSARCLIDKCHSAGAERLRKRRIIEQYHKGIIYAG
jgi:hypothetical protein